jgi:hypothetical protein
VLYLIEVSVEQFRAFRTSDKLCRYLLIKAESRLPHPFTSARFGSQYLNSLAEDGSVPFMWRSREHL